MSDKKLFQLVEVSSRKAVPNLYFGDKQDAKKKRNVLNEGSIKFIVAPGPDHSKFKSA